MSDFKKKVLAELIKTKKALYGEELKSALFAVVFAGSICLAVFNPISIWTFVNVFIAFSFGKKFRLTCKAQIVHDQHIKVLKDATKEEKS